MARDWVMVRVQRSTLEDLERVRERLLTAYSNGQVEVEMDDRGRVSLDQVIRVLITRDRLKKIRSDRSRARKKAARPKKAGPLD